MAALKYRKHQVLDGFTAFILCTKMSLCKIEEKIKKYPQTFIFIRYQKLFRLRLSLREKGPVLQFYECK